MFFKLRKQYPFSKVMQAINAAFMQGQPGNWTYIIGILQDGRDAWRKKKPSGMTVEKRGGKTYIDGLEVVL